MFILQKEIASQYIMMGSTGKQILILSTRTVAYIMLAFGAMMTPIIWVRVLIKSGTLIYHQSVKQPW